jgi:polyisoprenoid-binding protein YceI
MARWTFEPGHTAAEFRARHMMVTYVRGAFKNVHGTVDFDPENPRLSSVEATIDASTCTGERRPIGPRPQASWTPGPCS